MRERCRTLVRTVVSQTVNGPVETDLELAHLMTALRGWFFWSFSHEGPRIVTGSGEGTSREGRQPMAVRVVEAPPPKQVAVWAQEERAAAQSLAAVQHELKRSKPHL